MRLNTLVIVTAVAAASWACGRGTDPATTPASGQSQPSPSSLVDPPAVTSCAGFGVDTAAELLAVPAAALRVQTGPSESLGGQLCRYWSRDSLIGPGIQFLLETEPSEAAAASSLQSLRENAPAGDAAIRNAVDQAKSGPALIDFEGVGDEAFWDALTSAVNLRVGNVVASIQASSTRQLTPDKERIEVQLERRVAERIAAGLRR